MNKTITSKEIILNASREIAGKYGLNSISIRNVAAACGISIGSVYNYYPSKNDLIIATIDAIWREIIGGTPLCNPESDFCSNVQVLFNRIKTGSDKYPYFFTAHSVNLSDSDRNKGIKAMNQCFEGLKKELLNSLRNDTKVKKDLSFGRCSDSDFVEFVFSNILSALMNQRESIDILIEVIKKTIY